jgi:hypothetical protein
MTAPRTICGHDHKTLKHVLFAMTSPACNPNYEFNGALWDAYVAIHNPTHLAEILTELVRLLGYKVGDLSHYFADVQVWWYSKCDNPPLPEGIAVGANMQADWAEDRICHSLTMPQARTLASYLLDLVERGVKVEEGFELIVRGFELALVTDVDPSPLHPTLT